jgi:hypothetical protein
MKFILTIININPIIMITIMIDKIKHFLKRDQDITYYEEFHYIYITLRELITVIRTQNK